MRDVVFLFVHHDPSEEIEEVERELRLDNHVHGRLRDGLVRGLVQCLPDLLALRGLRVELDLHWLEAAVHEGQGVQPHIVGIVILGVRLVVVDAFAILPPSPESAPR